MRDLPSGTVTFLFTDIEGSTRLLRDNRPHYGEILAEHGEILRAAFESHGGREIDTQGDSFFAAFRTARDGVEAAVAAQRALAAHSWPGGAQPKVRMGMHTAEPDVSEGRYVGLGVHRAARICAAAHGGQVLLSSTTGDLVFDELPANAGLSDLGAHQLKDFDRPERVFQLVVEGLPSEFPPLRTKQPTDLPATAAAAEAHPVRWPLAVDRRLAWLLLAIGLAVLALVGIIAVSTGGSDSAAPSRSVAVIDIATNDVVDTIPLGSSATSVAAFDGGIWAVSPQERTLIRIDPKTREVTSRKGLGIAPYSLKAGNGTLWIAGGKGGSIVGFLPQVDEVNEPAALSFHPDGYPLIAPAGDVLWVGQNDAAGVVRYDLRTGRLVASGELSSSPEAIAASDEGVWVVARFDREIARIDPVSGSVVTRIPFGAPSPATGSSTLHPPKSDALLDESGLWVTDALEGKVWRFRPAEGSIQATIRVGSGALAIASGAGSIWIANNADGTVSRIEPETDRVTATIKVADSVSGIAVAAGAVWVAVP